MPAAVETNGTDAAFASLRTPAWHGLGTVLDEAVNTAEMLSIAHLDNWNVRLEPLVTQGRAHQERFEVVRDNPFDGLMDTLGVVGSRYNVFQNEELFSFGDLLLDGGRWETAGSIKDGTVVFGSLLLDSEGLLDPNGAADKHARYLLVSTSHDGSANLQASITDVRVVCANTLNIALAGTKQTFKIRHSQSMSGKVAEAKRVLGLAEHYFSVFDSEMEKLIQQTITNSEAEQILEMVFPVPDKENKRGNTVRDKKVEAIWANYNGPTCENVYGTKFGIFNAIEEYIDWGRTSRTGNEENILAAASGFDPATNVAKNDLYKKVLAFA